jgi:hypothetical protein
MICGPPPFIWKNIMAAASLCVREVVRRMPSVIASNAQRMPPLAKQG